MKTKAFCAIRAAKHVKQWGRFAAKRYAQRHGVSARLYRIARQCEAME